MLEPLQDQVAETLNKDYKDNDFINQMREVVSESIELNSLYRDLVKNKDCIFPFKFFDESEVLSGGPF